MRSTRPYASTRMDKNSVEEILAWIVKNQTELDAARLQLREVADQDSKTVAQEQLLELEILLKLTEEFLAHAAQSNAFNLDALNLRASKHPLPGMALFTYNNEQNHEDRLAQLGLDTSAVPDIYRCPIGLDVIDQPVPLKSYASDKTVIYQYFEYKNIRHLEVHPETRTRLYESDIQISKAQQNIISAFVRFHEIHHHLMTRQLTRNKLIAALPESKEKNLLQLSNTELLQVAGIPVDQVPDRYISPQFQPGVPKTVFTFPVIIETTQQDEHGKHQQDSSMTICFYELLRYQDYLYHIDDEQKQQELATEKRRRKMVLEEQKRYNLMRAYLHNEDDEIALDYAAFRHEIEHKMGCKLTESLTFDDIKKSELSVLINPFTGKPLESLEINYALMHELDMFMMTCYFQHLEELRKRYMQCATRLHQSQLPKQIAVLEQQSKNLHEKLDDLLPKPAFTDILNQVRETVQQYNDKAANGDIKEYIYRGSHMKYKHPGKSYSDVLNEAGIEAPEQLRLGLIPATRGGACKLEFMTHPIILDHEFVIDYDTLLAFWKERSPFLGLFGGHKDRTGMNPFTGKPIKTIGYDKTLKAKIDQYMMENNFFEITNTLVVHAPFNRSFGFTFNPAGARRRGACRAVARSAEADALTDIALHSPEKIANRN